MLNVGDFYDAIDGFAPFHTAYSWDNVGLLIGSRQLPADRVLLALDLTGPVLMEAAALNAPLIITHHPVIWKALSRLDADSIVYRAVAAGVSVISAHTNLDLAQGGVNDALAQRLGLRNIRPFKAREAEPRDEEPAHNELRYSLSLGRLGDLDATLTATALANRVRERLGAAGLRYVPSPREIFTVAVCGGSGGNLIADARSMGAQALITADVKHDQLLEAAVAGITVIDAGHFATENTVMEPLRDALSRLLPGAGLYLSKSCTDGICYLI